MTEIKSKSAAFMYIYIYINVQTRQTFQAGALSNFFHDWVWVQFMYVYPVVLIVIWCYFPAAKMWCGKQWIPISDRFSWELCHMFKVLTICISYQHI